MDFVFYVKKDTNEIKILSFLEQNDELTLKLDIITEFKGDISESEVKKEPSVIPLQEMEDYVKNELHDQLLSSTENLLIKQITQSPESLKRNSLKVQEMSSVVSKNS